MPRRSALRRKTPLAGRGLASCWAAAARGAAHVGILKVLEELRIPVDYVAGCSMGSIVGGLYASGMTPAQIERDLLGMDWDDLFKDYPSREERSFRRKRDDDFYVFKVKPGYNDGEVQIPLAYIRGQKFDLAEPSDAVDVRGEGFRSHAHSLSGRRH